MREAHKELRKTKQNKKPNLKLLGRKKKLKLEKKFKELKQKLYRNR